MIRERRDESGRILELRLDRPPANALNAELLGLLTRHVRAASESDAGAVVLSGLPGTFSAGLDIHELLRLDAAGIAELWRSLLDALRGVASSAVPVVAALTGHAPAGGAVLALCCDYRVMSEGEYGIGLNEVAVGIPLPRLIFELLERIVGSRQAEKLAVSGRMVSPAEALAIGLVDELAPPDEVVARAEARCQELLCLPRRAMLETRATARASLMGELAEEDEALIDRLVEAVQAPDTRQALQAVAKRLTQPLR
ncbi:MAG: enoyl-CoA hydratase/isomerase family protein [Thermoanaerobaculia bacterium]